MLCAPFETATEHSQRFQAAGFSDVQTRLITPHILRTWDICIRVRRHPILEGLSRVLGEDVRAFTDSFSILRQAYQESAMEYGMFFARKSSS
jgi:hypothetical protein